MVRALLVLAAASILSAPSASQVAGTTLPDGFVESTAWTVPDAATALRFAPGGHVFVAGKSGVIYEFDGLGDTTPTVVADLRPEVYGGFDRGLLGLAVDPGYATGRPYLYAAYTYDKNPVTGSAWNDGCSGAQALAGNCPVMGRISRIGPDGSEKVLVEDFCDQFDSHSMGALAFGPDGDLYAAAGEGDNYGGVDYGQFGDPVNPCGDPPGGVLTPPTAQGGALRAQSYRRPDGQPVSLDGALLRLDPDTGLAAAGNPQATDAQRRRMIAYGFRNPFRFTFRPGTGEVWVGDVGFSTWEEIDRVPDVSQVRNYGWPCYEGSAAEPDYAAVGLDSCTSLAEGNTVKPVLAYRHGTALAGCAGTSSAISGLAFYDGTAFPARYRGRLFFADYVRRCIWTMDPADPASVTLFAANAAGPADLEVGPDGALYYADVYDDEIRRIAAVPPTPTPTATATATATVTPTPAPPPPTSLPAALPPLRAPADLRMTRRGFVTIRLSCPAAACRFSARLRYRGRTLGRAAGDGTLRVRLSPRGQALVRRGIRLSLTVTRTIGTHTQTATRRLRIRR